jgi:magnesium transporter
MSTGESESDALSTEELREAWIVLSVSERLDGLRCLDTVEARDFFSELTAVERATLLLDMSTEERSTWLETLDPIEVVELVDVVGDTDRGLILLTLPPATHEEVKALLQEAKEEQPEAPEAQEQPSTPGFLEMADVTSAQVHIFKSLGRDIVQVDRIEPGTWINLVNPSQRVTARLASMLDIDVDVLNAALDEEERPRVSVEDNALLIIIDVPTIAKEGSLDLYTTIPLAMIVSSNWVVTVCLRGDTLLEDFSSGLVRGFSTDNPIRFLLQVMHRSATRYLKYLRSIDRTSHRIEEELHGSLKNKELIQLLKLEKSLVYFSTSLKSNEAVIERLVRLQSGKLNEVDQELLDDVIVEHKQALEMANIYSNILTGTMDAFASVISNNLNIVMKVLTSVTIVLAIPTMVASFFGMNVGLPFSGPHAFQFVVAIAGGGAALAILLLWRGKML